MAVMIAMRCDDHAVNAKPILTPMRQDRAIRRRTLAAVGANEFHRPQ
jgi:hypothetical protein